jgi:hypothetical protein
MGMAHVCQAIKQVDFLTKWKPCMQLIYKFGYMGMFDCVNLALENFSHLGLNSSQEFMTFCHDNIKIIKLIIM